MTDFITLLHTTGGLLATKRWTKDEIKPYDEAATFSVTERPVNNIFELSKVLGEAESDPHTLAIRGKWNGGSEYTPRQKLYFTEASHHWLMVDVDWYEPVLADPVAEPVAAIEEFITTQLPEEMHGASYHWHLSSSAGAPGKEHILKAHLFFWLDEPRGHRELDAWWFAIDKKVDRVAWRRVQPLYIAAPVIDEGVSCPVTMRSGFVEGSHDVVSLVVPDLLEAADAYTDGAPLTDPGEKPGLIGDFCRAFPPYRVVEELLPEEFEFQEDSETRLNWLNSASNSAGSAFIGRDGHHIVNVSNTAPESERALNSWDVVRVYKFGQLDDGVEADSIENEIGKRPSDVAMYKWVRETPEVQAALFEEAIAPKAAPLQRADEEKPDEPSAGATSASHAETEAPVTTPEAPKEPTRLERAVAAIKRCPTPQDLEHRLVPSLREITEWSDGDRIELIAQVQACFKALTGNALPKATAREWLKPLPGAQGFQHVNEQGRPLGTIENLQEVLKTLDATVRYNSMAKQDEVDFETQTFSIDNRANVALALVRSECNRVEMKIDTQSIKAFVNRLGEQNQYSPPLDWIGSAPWDGRDRLEEWYATVTSPDAKLKKVLMFRWALQAVALLYNNGTMSSRGVLTFTGAQYAGKTRWLKALAPEGMVLVGHTLDVHKTDSVKKAVSYWITELGELDGTLRKSDMAALKAFITGFDDEMRLPYAPCASKYPRRTCFAATVNTAEFLKDSTGNTRYWTIQADAIEADHGIDMQQLWAQVHQLWLNEGQPERLQHWLTLDEVTMLNASNEDFTETDPLEELVRTKLDWSAPNGLIWSTATQIGERLGKQGINRFEAARLGAVVRRVNGNVHRRSNGVKLLQVPAPVGDSIED